MPETTSVTKRCVHLCTLRVIFVQVVSAESIFSSILSNISSSQSAFERELSCSVFSFSSRSHPLHLEMMNIRPWTRAREHNIRRPWRSVPNEHVQNRIAIPCFAVDVGTMLQQQIDELRLVCHGRPTKRVLSELAALNAAAIREPDKFKDALSFALEQFSLLVVRAFF